jgi:hypothetical protein
LKVFLSLSTLFLGARKGLADTAWKRRMQDI